MLDTPIGKSQAKDNIYIPVPGDPTPTGTKVNLYNPENGADIRFDSYLWGEKFILERGKTIQVDKALAESAKINWNFLQILPITNGKQNTVIGTIPKEEIPFTQTESEYDLMTDEELKAVAKDIGIKGYATTKRENLILKIQETENVDTENL